jgi:iojap-like ribosome-associated protein
MNEELNKKAAALVAFLEEHNCKDVKIVDLGENNSVADCFVIATVTSVGHLKGVAHQLWGEIIDLGLEVSNRHKNVSEDGWTLIDCGSIVIHLMSTELRDFYSLEKLWQKTANL